MQTTPAPRRSLTSRRSFVDAGAGRLGNRVLGWFVIFVVALAAVGGVLAWRKYRNEEARVRDDIRLLADASGREIDGWMADRIQMLGALATSNDLRGGVPAAASAAINRVDLANAGFSGGIGWVDRDGVLRALAPMPAGFAPVSLADRSYVRTVLASGQPYVSEGVVARNGPDVLVALAVPTRDANGAIDGVLVGTVKVADLETRVVGDPRARRDLVVIDRDGQVLVDKGAPVALRPVPDAPGVDRLRALGAGVDRGPSVGAGVGDWVRGFSAAPTAGWLVVAERSADAAFGRLWRDFLVEVLLLAAVAAAAVALGLADTRRVDRLQLQMVDALDAERDAREAAEAARRQVEDLARITERLVQAPTVTETIAVAREEIERVEPAARVTLARLDPTGRFLHVDRVNPQLGSDRARHWQRLAVDGDDPIARAVRERQAQWFSTPDELHAAWADTELAPDVRAAGVAAGATMPLVVAGRSVGALNLSFTEPHEFDERDRTLLQNIARLLAQNLDRAAAFDAEHRVNRRLTELQDAIATVAASEGFEPSAQAVVERVLSAVDAQGCALLLAVADADALALHTAAGSLDAVLRATYAHMPLERRSSVCAAYRDRRTVRVGSPEEWVEMFPDAAALPGAGARAALAVPLVGDLDSDALGVLMLVFLEDLPLGDADVALVEAFARQASQALLRARTFDAERRTRHQLQVLSTLSSELETSTTVEGRVDALARTLSPSYADFIVVEVERENESPLSFVRHPDPGQRARWEAFRADRLAAGDAPLISAVARRVGSVVVPDARAAVSGVPRPMFDALQVHSLVLTPLRVRGGVNGALALVRCHGRDPFDADEDGDLADEIGRRFALALDNAQLYEREHQVAETLQRSLLPDRLPEVPGLAVAALYRPGTAGLHIGGDWYDVTELSDGRIALTIGDVVGRGERAAVTMGRLRTLLADRLAATADPAEVISYLDRVLQTHDDMATALVVLLDLATGEVHYAGAGHPPPLVVGADHSTGYLPLVPSVPLGVGDPRPRPSHRETIERGATLVLYTDGLVERRREPIDRGLARLALAARSIAADAVDGSWCETLADRLVGDRADDDLAVLAVQLVPGAVPHLHLEMPAQPAQLAPLRASLRRWLGTLRASPDDVDSLVLAVNEAAANVVTHAYGPAGGPLHVTGTVDDGRVTVTVRDEGTWRSSRSASAGHGLALIGRLSDEHDVDRTPTGTVVTMHRRLRVLAQSDAS